jgi:DNA mismatch repair ATPase MutL
MDLPQHRFSVSDNGQGIAFEDLDLIGQRYATSKCSGLQDLSTLQVMAPACAVCSPGSSPVV